MAPVAGILRLAESATPVHTLEALTKAALIKAKKHHPETGKKTSAKAPKKTARAKNKAQDAAAISTPRIFKSQPPMLERVTGPMADRVINSLTVYADSLQPERRHFLSKYRPIDVAFKVVGTGSIGLRDYVVYLDGNGPADPLFLQIKEETASAYAPYAAGFDPGRRRAAGRHNGRRVVDGERAMQVQSDPFLGWTTLEGRDYLVRQLNDHKASIRLEDLGAVELMEYAAVCGELLARGHGRSGDPALIAGYLGGSARFDQAITTFAFAYADQTEADWKQLARSLKHTGKPPTLKPTN